MIPDIVPSWWMYRVKEGRLPAPSLVRPEPELPKELQDSIKQLQDCNNEFQDKDKQIHSAHTRLLW
ncbi:hypothetical protein BN133_3414 [Cronobacter dublinensis 582]|nr:hypothetical protein BN133_3414 [Cronobacter dublinensis 582]